MDQLKGKVAIVTGAASGIGAACAETLAREGARVMATDIDDPAGADLVAKIKAAGGEVIYLPLDVTDEAQWGEVVAATEARFGRLDILVANAAIMLISPTIEMTLADWRRQMAVNLDSAFLSVKYCVPAMRRVGSGSIVMMSSIAGLRGSAGMAGFCATKGGMRLFTKAIALEYAREGIRVNSVHPGMIDPRSGASCRSAAAICRSICPRWRGRGCRSESPGERRTLPMACCFSPPICRGT